MFRSFGTIAMLAVAASIADVALAQSETEEPAYLDDRSTPVQLVLSYFNAIDRAEHVRAHSYFGADEAPGYDAWQFQFDDVVATEVSFGQMAQEGAAGSIYYQLPVTVDFEHAQGRHHIERGCINMRWVNPANQLRPPFQPLHIISADLRSEVVEQGFAPAQCFSAPNEDTGSPAFLDDRSTAEQIVRSYYNALERGEYGRAVGYLGTNAAPSDYQAWWQSFADFGRLELSLGTPAHYSTAGYILYGVPVAAAVNAQGGEDWVEVGCIGVHQDMPGDEEPFTPMYITGVTLEPHPAGATPPLPACND